MAEAQTIKNPDTGHEIKISSALTYDKDSKVYQLASQMANAGDDKQSPAEPPHSRSHKPKTEHIGPNKEVIAKYGKYKLNAYPPENVNEKDVIVNTNGNINTHAVLKWKDPKSGRTVNAYTQKFMEANAKIKWKRIEKIKPEFVDKIKSESKKLLQSKNPKMADAGACISLISQTGLRPGSRLGFGVTGNRGISTLGPDNIKIEGSKIKINFIGKSYQENVTEVDDLELANYLKRRINERPNEKFVFDLEKNELDDVFHKMTNHKIKIKDLRTYTATKLASDILETSEFPKELPDNPKKVKKIIKGILANVFEKVSQKLNNTPAMAKSSYVHPKIIEQWLKIHNLEPSLAEHRKYSLTNYLLTEQAETMNSEDLENCDEYPLPSWWDNDNIELVKINKSSGVNESKVGNKSTIEFVKSLEQSGLVAKNTYKNKTVMDTIQSIISMPKQEFDKTMKTTPNKNAVIIHREFSDWKQTYTKPITEYIDYEQEIFGGSGLEPYIKDAKVWWNSLSINEMRPLYKKYFNYGDYKDYNSSNILKMYIKEKFKPSDEEYRKTKDWWDRHKIRF